VVIPRWLALLSVGTALAVLVNSTLAAAGMQRSGAPVPHHPAFREVASARGLDFTQINGASEQKFFPEIMGSGGLLLDFDNDGWLDVFLVDGGSFADSAVAGRARHRLYRNRGVTTSPPRSAGPAPTSWNGFQDVTAASGIRHRDYGMGACAGDIDNDGLIDLYITNVGANLLYRHLEHELRLRRSRS
jgi:hypothetical protein